MALLLTLPNPAGEVTRYGQSLVLLRTQYALFLGLAPVMLILFRQVSLLAPLVNLVAIPFIGLLVVPLCLLALVSAWFAPALAEYLIVLPDALLAAFESTLFALTRAVPAWRVAFPTLPAWLLALLAGVIAIHLIRPRAATWLALALVATLAHGYRGQRLAPGSFQLDILDVGQGLAVTIATRHHLLLYDTGPAYCPRFNAGEGIIVPFLAAVNLGVPDLVIISHGDSDHAGGLACISGSCRRMKRAGKATMPPVSCRFLPALSVHSCQATSRRKPSWSLSAVTGKALPPRYCWLLTMAAKHPPHRFSSASSIRSMLFSRRVTSTGSTTLILE